MGNGKWEPGDGFPFFYAVYLKYSLEALQTGQR